MRAQQDNRTFYHYISDLVRFDPTGMVVIFCLMVINSITVGIGILMVIPLLGLLGISSGESSQEQSSGPLVGFIQDTGINFNLYDILLFYVGLVCINQFVIHYQNIRRTRLGLTFAESFKIRLYKGIGNADWLFITSSRSSDFMHLLSSDANRIESGTTSGLNLLVGLLLLMVYTILCLNLSVSLTLFAVVVGGIYLVIFRPLNKRALQLGTDLSTDRQSLYANLNEFMGNLKLIKGHALQEYHIDKFQQSISAQKQSRIKFASQSGLAGAGFKIVSALTVSLFVVFAIEIIQLPLAELFVLLVILSRVLPQFSNLQQNYQRMLNMLPSYSMVLDMIDKCEEAAEDNSEDPDMVPISLSREITLSNVCFSYQSTQDSYVLKNINLSIPAGEITAIIGRSGAGKSTLADLITGLITPDEGEIMIDHTPLTGPLLKSWRRQVAYVPQETFLFHDTIRSNICWGKADIDDKQLMDVLVSVDALEFVENLPSGLDTVVGDRGTRLSGGQRQRIALARALLHKPQLLLLDEASSSLDHETEAYINNTLAGLKGTLTIVVIAHRLSTIRDADQILVLENGEVIRTGNWQILEKQGQTQWLDDIAVI